ncbi:hypothetical protein [Agromyces sp. Leaf222]|uniref:hypothetical protein n=1 Tax=Agromyces sp. Leaf222 TaxID=1735688 RepID=UPI0006FCBB6D|nr:hypothetical protein [Agromyces sp. Leaf222]KQM83513.1 hypothetical protein ASE68_10010 [Agromyces sp. Leaf222]
MAGAGIAGYRILRRIGSGSRADVFLAVAQHAEASGDASADRRADSPCETAPLVVMRIYRDDVDDLSIAAELDAMHAVPGAGLPTLLDVATTDSGGRVAVVERIGGATVAQVIHERSLEPGEAVTLIAPVVAGIARLAEAGFVHGRLAPSDVQLDSSGRPRLLGLGGLEPLPGDHASATMLRRTGLDALTAYVDQVVGAVRPVGVFDAAVDLAKTALATRPFSPFERDLEQALFRAAAPAPVAGLPPVRELRLPARVLAPQAPEPVEAAATAGPGAKRMRRRGLPGQAESRRLTSGLFDLAEVPVPLIEHLAESADADRVATVRRRATAWVGARRRPVVVGALLGAAALVLLLTVVPSAGGGTDGNQGATASADAGRAVAGAAEDAEADGDPAATSTPNAGAVTDAESSVDEGEADDDEAGSPGEGLESQDPVVGARSLLQLRESCFAELDPSCVASYVQPGSPLEDADWNLMLAARDGAGGVEAYDPERMEVVTEMGAAVLVQVARVDDEEPASLLVVRSEAGWRLREIFD